MPIPDPAFNPITPLPPPPLRGTQPEVFIPTAEEFLSAIVIFAAEANTLASQMVTLAEVAEQGATTAEAAVTDAQIAVTDAQTAVTDAQAWADAAAVSAGNAASAAEAVTATTSTSMTFGTGTKTLTLNEANKPYVAGQWIYLTDPASPSTRWLHGTITSFTSATGNMTVDVVTARGTGSHADWIVVNAVPVYGVPSFDANGNATFTNNLSVGAGLRNWNSNYKVLQTGDGGWMAGRVGTYGVEFGSNWFRNAASNYERVALGTVGHYSIEGADHVWSRAASGAAGSTFTLTESMRLSAAGVLTVGGNAIWHAGNFNPASKLDASANAVSATRLQTARNINGVPFDGTSDITIVAGAGTYLPLAGGTLTGALTGTTGAFSGLTVSGNAVWHAGNFNPSNYATTASLASYATTASLAGYAQLAGATFTGAVSSRGGDAGTVLFTQNNAASNGTQFFVTHNGSETQVGNARGALNLFSNGVSRMVMNTTSVSASLPIQSTGLLYGNTGSAEGNGLGRVYLSTGGPSGGAQGDIWCVY